MIKLILTFLLLLLSVSGRAADKNVKIAWKPLEGAVKFELELKHGSVVKMKTVLAPDITHWSGKLKPGVYHYRLRAVDRIGRPGEWSRPHSKLVEPDGIELSSPKADKSFVNNSAKAEMLFSWKLISDADQYEFELYLGEKRVEQKRLSEPVIEFTALEAGEYFWQVRALVLAPRGTPNEIKERYAEGPWSEKRRLLIQGMELGKPEITEPSDIYVVPSSGKKVRLSWTAVKGAEGYQVYIVERFKRGPDAKRDKKTTTHIVKTPTLSIDVADDASYSWLVQAVGNFSTNGTPQVRGPSATSVFTTRDKLYVPGLKLALNGAVTAFQYSGGGAVVGGLPLRGLGYLTVEYFPWDSIGFGTEVGGAFYRFFGTGIFDFESITYRGLYKFGLLYKSGHNGFWYGASLYAEERDTFRVLPGAGVSAPEQFGVIGATLGGWLRRDLNKNFYVLGYAETFRPMGILALSSASVRAAGIFDNIKLGGQVFMRLGDRFYIGAGVHFDKSLIKYRQTTNGVERNIDLDIQNYGLSGSLSMEWE